MVCILALFRIEKIEGSEKVEWVRGLSTCVARCLEMSPSDVDFGRHPLPFPCAFVPRDGEIDARKLASLIYASRVES